MISSYQLRDKNLTVCNISHNDEYKIHGSLILEYRYCIYRHTMYTLDIFPKRKLRTSIPFISEDYTDGLTSGNHKCKTS